MSTQEVFEVQVESPEAAFIADLQQAAADLARISAWLNATAPRLVDSEGKPAVVAASMMRTVAGGAAHGSRELAAIRARLPLSFGLLPPRS